MKPAKRVKASPGLEPEDAEKLLLATGLLKLPDREAVKASKDVWRELIGLLAAALELEEQDKLRAPQVTDSYFDRLLRAIDSDYDEFIEANPTIGAQFQLLQTEAQQHLKDAHPTATVTTVAGDRDIDLEPDGVEQKLWLLKADTVEFPQRLIYDLAAGALCYAQVQTFEAVFPETYSGIVQVAQGLCDKKGPKWMPPLWLNDALRVLYQEELATGVEVTTEAPKPLSPRRTKGTLDLASFKAPGQEGI